MPPISRPTTQDLKASPLFASLPGSVENVVLHAGLVVALISVSASPGWKSDWPPEVWAGVGVITVVGLVAGIIISRR